MDTLCHGRETRPHAIMLFRRVLHLDALLTGMNSAYDRDHLEVVSVREDARYHRPGIDVPVNNAELPCGLCRRMSLGLDPDVVLLHVHGGAA